MQLNVEPKPGDPGFLEYLMQKMGAGGPQPMSAYNQFSVDMMGGAPQPSPMEPFAGIGDRFDDWKQQRMFERSAPAAAGARAADRSYLGGMNSAHDLAKSGMTIQQALETDPSKLGMRNAMKAGVPFGQAVKELPYDLKRGFQGTNMIGTAVGAGTGMLMGKNGSSAEKSLATAGGTIGAALGTMIPVPFVGQAVGGLLGSTAGKLLGGIFGGDDEDEAKKKAEREQKINALRQNLDRIASMYRR